MNAGMNQFKDYFLGLSKPDPRIYKLVLDACEATAEETLVVTGVSLNVGIQGTVIEALNHGYHVVLVTDCVTGYPPEYAEMVLANSLARITTPTTSDALLELWA